MSLLKSLTTKEDIRHIITTDYNGQTLHQIEDALHEITDSIMPIYYNDIIGEWQAMPSEYNGEGVSQFGMPEPDSITIYKLMELDLFAFYFDEVSHVFNELQEQGYFDESEPTE
jgi:hypothetical protein